MYEVMIVGGGPAGMTAAVYAARKKMSTLLVSKDLGGQPLNSSGVENYMGYQFVSGPELMAKFEEQVRQFPIEVKTGEEVASVSPIEGGFEARTMKGQAYQARAAIVATGKAPRPLGVPGEERLRGRGVTYCAICDGPLFDGMKVAVIGGGNSALEVADDMIKIAEHVYLVSSTRLSGDRVIRDRVTAAPNVTVLTGYETTEIVGDGLVSGIKIRDTGSGEVRELEVDGVLIEVGLIPSSALVKGLAPINERGEIEVNCACETGVPGLYAAGDVTNAPEKQIVISAGEGAKAALQAHRYLQRLRQG